MTLIDKGCWERGCACYDSRVANETFEVVQKREWINLTNEEIGEIYRVGWAANMELARAIEAKLKEKNT
jgi:hypothetical protein